MIFQGEYNYSRVVAMLEHNIRAATDRRRNWRLPELDIRMEER
jgi:hypothetical protein